MAQIAVPFSETTSEGEKDDNSDDARVTSNDGDPSWLEAVCTMAWQSLVLAERQKEREIVKEIKTVRERDRQREIESETER